MAKLRLPADALAEVLMGQPNFVTLNGVQWDPVNRVVTFDIVGSDVPNVDEVILINHIQRTSTLVPAT